MSGTILILGACGQIGTELTLALRDKYGTDQIVASDIRRSDLAELQDGPFEILDASDADALRTVCEQYKVHTVYHLVAMLSATGEKFPMKAWDLNMQSLLHVLELAREGVIQKIFGPAPLPFLDRPRLKNIPRSKPLWSPQLCTASPSLRASVGVNTTSISTA
jgi:nucleoside-diphosphate-sugar epimerase